MQESRRTYLAAIGSMGLSFTTGCNQSNDNDTPTTAARTRSTTGSAADAIRFHGGTRADFQAALDALSTGDASRLVLESETYRFQSPATREPGAFFQLRGADDVEIDGRGATLSFANPLWSGFEVLGGSNVTIRNVTLDYDPLPFTQGIITRYDPPTRTVRIEIADGYPTLDHRMFAAARHVAGSVHRSDGSFQSGLERLPGAVFLRVAAIDRVTDRMFDVTFTEPSPVHTIEAGLILALGIRNAQTLTALGTSGLVLEDLTIRAAPGMALNTDRCDAPELTNVTVAPPPDSGRCLGPNADALHLSHCSNGPHLEGCRVRQTRDDGIVIDSDLIRVSKVNGRTVEFEPAGKLPVAPGDVLVPMSPTGILRDALPPVRSVTHRYPDRPQWAPNGPKSITFETSVDGKVEPGAYLGSNSYANAGFVVADTSVSAIGANAIRLAARSGRIEDSTIDGTGWRGIALRCDSGGDRQSQRWSNDITIRSTTISRPGMTNIALEEPTGIHATHNPGAEYAQVGRPHHDIAVEHADIRGGAHLGVLLEAVENAQIRETAIGDMNRLPFLRDGTGFGLGVSNVQDVEVSTTTVRGTERTLYQFGWKMDGTNVSVRDDRLTVDEERWSPRVITWEPLAIDFDRVIHPGRYIALRCFELALVDAAGDDVIRVSIGGRELPIEFGTGVYEVDVDNGRGCRWFGGEDKRATIYATSTDISAASQLLLRGNPAASGMSATLSTEDGTSAAVTLGSPRQLQDYRFELPS